MQLCLLQNMIIRCGGVKRSGLEVSCEVSLWVYHQALHCERSGPLQHSKMPRSTNLSKIYPKDCFSGGGLQSRDPKLSQIDPKSENCPETIHSQMAQRLKNLIAAFGAENFERSWIEIFHRALLCTPAGPQKYKLRSGLIFVYRRASHTFSQFWAPLIGT